MSVSLNIGSFQNPADRNRKEQQYKEYLRLQSKLNEKSEKAFGELARNTVMGIKPAPLQYKSTEEEFQDEVAQRELAVKNLREIMPREGLQGLSYLPTINDLNLFNRSFPDFKQKISNQKFITPIFFGQLWEQYKDYLASTNYTGISIPLTQTGLEHTLRQVMNVILNRIDDSFELSRKERRAIVDYLDKAVRDGNADVVDRVNQAVMDGRVDVLATIINSAEESRAQVNELRLQTMTIKQLKKLLMEITGLDTDRQLREHFQITTADLKNKDVLINAILSARPNDEEGRRRGSSRSSSAPSSPATGSSRSDTSRGIDEAIAQGYAGVDPSSPIRGPGTASLVSMEAPRSFVTVPLNSSQSSGSSGRTARTATSSQIRSLFGSGGRPMHISGTACAVSRNARNALVPRGVVRGRGLQAPPPERFLSFGKFWIHMPSLKQSKLNIKYPSFARIAELPITPISTSLKNFIRDLVENQRMNIKAYQALNESDRKIFNKAARRAKIDEFLGIDEEDEAQQEKEQMIDRFHILKGEIDAGNDAPQIKQEMKRILSRFISDGTIGKAAGTQLLIELSI